MNATARPKDAADPARIVASDVHPSSAWHSRVAFSNSLLATTIVRVALAIEERERQAVVEAGAAGLPGAHGSGGTSERDGSLNPRAKLGAPSDDVPMRLDAHSVEEAS